LSLQAKFLQTDVNGLYETFFDDVLLILLQDYNNWNQYSPEPRVLSTILFSTPNFLKKMGKLIGIFAVYCEVEKDIELRERMISLLLILFKGLVGSDVSPMVPFIAPFLKTIIMKSCIWRAGKRATELRAISIELFLTFTLIFSNHPEFSNATHVLFESDVIPVIVTNLDDDNIQTRENCLDLLQIFLPFKFFTGIQN
jgi:hypothetical protein